MGSAISVFQKSNNLINQPIKNNIQENVIVNNENKLIKQERLSSIKVSIVGSTETTTNMIDDVEKEKLLDSFNLKKQNSNLKFFTSPDDTNNDRENEDLFDINQSQSDISCSVPSSRQSSVQNSPAHGIKLQKALSFRLPKNDVLIHKLQKKLSLNNEKKKTIVCDVINEHDDKINSFIIETHDYKNDSTKQDYIKFHSFSFSPIKSKSHSEIDSIRVRKHTCELCSLTFTDEKKFIDHTKRVKGIITDLFDISMGSATSVLYGSRKSNNIKKKFKRQKTFKLIKLNVRTTSLKNEDSKLLDSFRMTKPLFPSPSRIKSLFISPKVSKKDDNLLINSYRINTIDENKRIDNDIDGDDIDNETEMDDHTKHTAKLKKALSFRFPTHEEINRNKNMKSNKNIKQLKFQLVDEEDSTHEIKSFVIQTHDYSKNNNSQSKLHISPTFLNNSTRRSVNNDNDSNKNNKNKSHICNLCSLTFDDECSFINHTKYSKIHEIAVLTYRSRMKHSLRIV